MVVRTESGHKAKSSGEKYERPVSFSRRLADGGPRDRFSERSLRLARRMAGDKLAYRAETALPVSLRFTEPPRDRPVSEWPLSPGARFDGLRVIRPCGCR